VRQARTCPLDALVTEVGRDDAALVGGHPQLVPSGLHRAE
jgi:hypothetical protein